MSPRTSRRAGLAQRLPSGPALYETDLTSGSLPDWLTFSAAPSDSSDVSSVGARTWDDGTLHVETDDAEPVFRDGLLGLLPARQNLITNQAGKRVVGSGAPDQWSLTPQTGMTFDFTPDQEIDGHRGAVVHITGSRADNANTDIFFELPIEAVAGDTLTASAYVALVGGSWTGAAASLRVGEYTDELVGISSSSSGSFTPTSDLQQIEVSRVIGSTAAFVRPFLRFRQTADVTVDAQLFISPQFEAGYPAYAVIPTEGDGLRRNEEVLTFRPEPGPYDILIEAGDEVRWFFEVDVSADGWKVLTPDGIAGASALKAWAAKRPAVSLRRSLAPDALPDTVQIIDAETGREGGSSASAWQGTNSFRFEQPTSGQQSAWVQEAGFWRLRVTAGDWYTVTGLARADSFSELWLIKSDSTGRQTLLGCDDVNTIAQTEINGYAPTMFGHIADGKYGSGVSVRGGLADDFHVVGFTKAGDYVAYHLDGEVGLEPELDQRRTYISGSHKAFRRTPGTQPFSGDVVMVLQAVPALTDAQMTRAMALFMDRKARLPTPAARVDWITSGDRTPDGFRVFMETDKASSLATLHLNGESAFGAADTLTITAGVDVLEEGGPFYHYEWDLKGLLPAGTRYWGQFTIDGERDTGETGTFKAKTGYPIGVAVEEDILISACNDAKPATVTLSDEAMAAIEFDEQWELGDQGYSNQTVVSLATSRQNERRWLRNPSVARRHRAGITRRRKSDHDWGPNNSSTTTAYHFPDGSAATYLDMGPVVRKASRECIPYETPWQVLQGETDWDKVLECGFWVIGGTTAVIAPDTQSNRTKAAGGSYDSMLGDGIVPPGSYDQVSATEDMIDHAAAIGCTQSLFASAAGDDYDGWLDEFTTDWETRLKPKFYASVLRALGIKGDDHHHGWDMFARWGLAYFMTSGVYQSNALSGAGVWEWFGREGGIFGNTRAFVKMTLKATGELAMTMFGKPYSDAGEPTEVATFATDERLPIASITNLSALAAASPGDTVAMTVGLATISQVGGAEADWSTNDGQSGSVFIMPNSRVGTFNVVAPATGLALSNPSRCLLAPYRITEAGDFRTTEAGALRLVE